MRRIVYLQGGGPTAVINESFLGVLSAARKEKASLYVSRNGLMGLIENRLERIDLEKDFSFLTRFPGAYFGSARISLKKDPESLLAILKTLKENKADALLLNGGNDTMDSAMRISKAVEEELPSCHVVGIPKTIDNDLVGTDRCPGFLSAAKYVAYNVSAILADDRSYKKGRINVIEVMGRDNGSLAASASLAFLDGKPDFIFIPEISFHLTSAIKKMEETYDAKGRCNVVVSEGIRDEKGHLVSSLKASDSFGNIQLGGVSSLLSSLVAKDGYKTRAIELSIPQRAAFYLKSEYDSRDAFLCGETATEESRRNSGVMIGIKGKKDSSFDYRIVPLVDVAGRTVPLNNRYFDAQKGILSTFAEDFEKLILGNI